MQPNVILGVLFAGMLLVTTGNDADAQGTRFRADWLFLRRDNDSSSQTLIGGPDNFTSGTDYDYESGYRLFFSAGTEQLDLEFQFSRLDDWSDLKTTRLFDELSFDNEFANPLVVAAPPANSLFFNSTLFSAAEFTDGALIDETTEGELLDAFSTVIYESVTDYTDFDVTLKTSRLRWYRFGIGYRHIDFDEANGLMILGTFSAIDADDGAIPGDLGNDPNDILSHEALEAVGLTSVSGGGGFGYGDDVLLDFDSRNRNRLDGAHLTFDGTVLNTSYFLVDVFANVGLFHNEISAQLTETYTAYGAADSVYTASYRGHENDMAWATGMGLRGAVKLTDNLRVHLGYEFLFIDGLALGPNQTRLTTFATIPVSGSDNVLLHGGRLGFEAVW